VQDKTLVAKPHEIIENISVHRVPVEFRQSLGDRLPLLGAYQTWTRIPAMVAAAAERAPADLVSGHSPPMFGSEASALAKRAGKPFIYDVHNLNADRALDDRTLRDLLTYPYYYFIERRLLTESDHIVVLSHALKRRIQARFKVPDARFTVVPNGVDLERFAPQREGSQQVASIKQQLGLSETVVMYAGYHDKINGIPSLLRVAPELLAQNPELSFLFIGTGPEEGPVKELAKEYSGRIVHLDSVPHEAMPHYYQLCDLFVIPRPSTLSSETITPIKLLEAMAMGRKVLCSDVGGLAELIQDGHNGFLFRKGDLGDLKRRMSEALRAPAEEIGARARDKVANEYTWDAAAQTLAACYSEALGQSR
jgi:glycosyltransferase involved in cell wall biosynthesis